MKLALRALVAVIGLVAVVGMSAAGIEDGLGGIEPTTANAPCCKICKKGKACGNSYIAIEKNCHQPPGCACDG